MPNIILKSIGVIQITFGYCLITGLFTFLLESLIPNQISEIIVLGVIISILKISPHSVSMSPFSFGLELRFQFHVD